METNEHEMLLFALDNLVALSDKLIQQRDSEGTEESLLYAKPINQNTGDTSGDN
jgi:hypothetical protein